LVFNSAGWRDNAAKRLQSGDRVILVGTKGDETPEPDKKRVLGMMEPSTKQVATSDFPLPDQRQMAHGKEKRSRVLHGRLSLSAGSRKKPTRGRPLVARELRNRD
jgi:hypothetical protein